MEDIKPDFDYYSVCTSKSKQEVENFADEIKTYILKGDWNTISSMISYPITIMGVNYSDAESLIHADISLREETISEIENADYTNLFVNYQGIMIGNGQVWIGDVFNDGKESGELKIIAINN